MMIPIKADDYEKQQEEVRKRLKKSGSELAKEIVKKTEEDPEKEVHCKMIRMLVDEALEEYREEGNLKETVESLVKALKAI